MVVLALSVPQEKGGLEEGAVGPVLGDALMCEGGWGGGDGLGFSCRMMRRRLVAAASQAGPRLGEVGHCGRRLRTCRPGTTPAIGVERCFGSSASR